jgi:hypothetical protein
MVPETPRLRALLALRDCGAILAPLEHEGLGELYRAGEARLSPLPNAPDLAIWRLSVGGLVSAMLAFEARR